MSEILSALAARQIPDFFSDLGGSFDRFYSNSSKIFLETGDLALISTLPNKTKVDTEGFLVAVNERLAKMM